MDSNMIWTREGKFQDFVDDWVVSEECALAKWCRRQGDIEMHVGLMNFHPLAKKSPEHAMWVHYHIGWLVEYPIRLEWTRLACNNPSVAARMWLEDSTLTDEQDEILEDCFRNPETGAPTLCEEIDSGMLVRVKKGEPTKYNEDSEIVQARIYGNYS